jgi:hypothetical protein
MSTGTKAPITPARIEQAAERLRLVAEQTARLLRPVPEEIGEGHPHREAIVGLRQLADLLAASPDLPACVSEHLRVSGLVGSWYGTAAVDAVINAGTRLGLPVTWSIGPDGRRHWEVDGKLGPLEINLFVVVAGDVMDYRVSEFGGDPS